MLADGGLGQGQAVYDLSAIALFFRFQKFDDLHAHRVPHGFADAGHRVQWKGLVVAMDGLIDGISR